MFNAVNKMKKDLWKEEAEEPVRSRFAHSPYRARRGQIMLNRQSKNAVRLVENQGSRHIHHRQGKSGTDAKVAGASGDKAGSGEGGEKQEVNVLIEDGEKGTSGDEDGLKLKVVPDSKQRLEDLRRRRPERMKQKLATRGSVTVQTKEIQQEEDLSSQLSHMNMNLEVPVMQQTAVSKIRRSIFHLPKSSEYTEYYPPDNDFSLPQPQQADTSTPITASNFSPASVATPIVAANAEAETTPATVSRSSRRGADTKARRGPRGPPTLVRARNPRTDPKTS